MIDDYQFATVGDFDNTSEASKVVSNIIAFKPEFLLNLGDFAYDTGSSNVDSWWTKIMKPLGTLKQYPVLGNHDVSDQNKYKTLFKNPSWVYSFSYKNIFFLMLNSETSHSQGSTQYAFADSELKKARENPAAVSAEYAAAKVRWIIVCFHEPIFNSTCTHSPKATFRDAMAPLFDKYHVDFCLSGHNHNYERTNPISYSVTNKDKPKIENDRITDYIDTFGTIYLVPGSGGRKLYDQNSKQYYIVKQFQGHGFLKLFMQLDGTKVSGEFLAIDGQVKDNFSILKEGLTPECPQGQKWNPVTMMCEPIIEPPTPCPEGTHRDPVTNQCVPDTIPTDWMERKISVTASGNDSNVPANVLDNNFSTRWSSDGKGQWIQAALESPASVGLVKIAWYKGNERKSNFVISVSTDGTNFKQVTSKISTGTTTQFEEYPFLTEEQNVKLVRVTVNGNSINNWASMTELRVLGKGTITPIPTCNEGQFYNPATQQCEQILDCGPDKHWDTVQLKCVDNTIPDTELIEDGVKMLYPLKKGGFTWSYEKNPDTGKFSTESDGAPVKKGDYYTIKAHKGSLDSGGTQWTMRLHIVPNASNVTEGTWKQAAQRGYLAVPSDPKNEEMTAFFRCTGVDSARKKSARVTHKIHGGRHSSGTNSVKAATIGIQLSTIDAARKELMEKELVHPKYDFIKVTTKFTIDPKDFENRWFGTKAISIVSEDKKSVKNQLWINTDPFTPNTNVSGPVNNDKWRLYFEWIDMGQNTGQYQQIVNWGGKISSFRVNEYSTIDFKKISVREIDPKATPTPTHECDPGFHWDDAQQTCVADPIDHTCPDGQHWSDAEQKCVPDDITPEPTGEILWDSNIHGKWNNGHARSITGHEEYDPDSNKSLFVAAGSGRKFEIKGNGTAFLSGDQSRIYVFGVGPAINSQMDITYVPNSSNENLSLRLRSRHGEGDPPTNRFGGYGASIHPATNEIKIKREDYHNVHTNASPGNVNYSKKVPNGQPITVRMVVKDEGSKVSTEMLADYENNGQFTQLAKGFDNSPKSNMTANDPLLKKKAYSWVRTNGTGTKNVEIRRLTIIKL